jgi:hypothetical protein
LVEDPDLGTEPLLVEDKKDKKLEPHPFVQDLKVGK